MLDSYPLSLPLMWHPSRPSAASPAPTWAVSLKYLYICACSAFLCTFCFPDPWDLFHLTLGPVLVWLILAVCIQLNRPKLIPYLAWTVVLSHMSFSHLRRQWTDWGGYKFDHTAPQMVMVLKLTSAAWAVHDYYVSRMAKRAGKDAHLSSRQRAMAIPVPSLLEFAAYIFYFGGLFVGPAFEIAEFRRFVSGDMFLEGAATSALAAAEDASAALDRGAAPAYVVGQIARTPTPSRVTPRVPNPTLPMLRALLTSIVFMGGVVTLSERYAFSRLLTPAYLAPITSVGTLVRRFWRLQLSGFAARQQYYSVWLLAEGSCILAGLGFKGVIDNWNMGTASWLKHSVYLRLTPPGTRPTALTTIATYATSAIWHGFYPGYYLTFISGALITETAKILRRTLRPRAVATGSATIKLAYDVGGWVLTQSVLNYVVAPFLLLGLDESWSVWKANAFVGHIGLLVAVVACKVIGAPRRPAPVAGLKAGVAVESDSPAVVLPVNAGKPASIFEADASGVKFELDADVMRRAAAAESGRSGSNSPTRRRRKTSPGLRSAVGA
ncbi:MBOAT, membrane-bound O-acyltransferase family-domain-containing protein [Catenaria anguillulae PL171]|uniref:MBOAT, membrane-bound O-acyltransferase family-domain-containing protein n=1 Tax=Catenaria anguillulae PL171 TaxID=765915 RepID=A0A1Y2HRP2_9FUNG|nr:MBOAT, membrane-bound O-acyltransferase family-domain-containing protein [Catenaria anguillulae PL171]